MKKTTQMFFIGFIILLCFSFVACSSDSNSESNSKKRQDTSNNSGPNGAIPPALSQGEFTKQVQEVCDSVDPKVFDDILKVDPVKDKDFQVKFDDAKSSLSKLNAGFNAITPPTNKAKEWQEGLDSLTQLESQVGLVSSQYKEYVALLAESETNTDPARTIQIISRLVELGREYFENLSAADKSFKKVLSVGASAGVTKCRAFEIGLT